MAPRTRTVLSNGAVVGSTDDLPHVEIAKNPATTKKVLVERGNLGHVTQISLAYHPKGQGCGLHDHPDMDEFFLVFGGTGEVTIGDDIYEAKVGDFFSAPRGVPHNLVGTSSQQFVVQCIGVRARDFEHVDDAFWAALAAAETAAASEADTVPVAASDTSPSSTSTAPSTGRATMTGYAPAVSAPGSPYSSASAGTTSGPGESVTPRLGGGKTPPGGSFVG